jgi:hypothetical protein
MASFFGLATIIFYAIPNFKTIPLFLKFNHAAYELTVEMFNNFNRALYFGARKVQYVCWGCLMYVEIYVPDK